MTLDKAIKIIEGNAEYWESKARIKTDGTMATKLFDEEQAKVYRQVTEWLRELKAYRKAMEEVKAYASIWTSYTVDMKPEEIAHRAVTDAKDGFLAIVDRCLEEVKADGTET